MYNIYMCVCVCVCVCECVCACVCACMYVITCFLSISIFSLFLNLHSSHREMADENKLKAELAIQRQALDSPVTFVGDLNVSSPSEKMLDQSSVVDNDSMSGSIVDSVIDVTDASINNGNVDGENINLSSPLGLSESILKNEEEDEEDEEEREGGKEIEVEVGYENLEARDREIVGRFGFSLPLHTKPYLTIY
jgi:hypothetical protein